MLLIQPPTHDEGAGFRQTFCGPAALSALTGLPAETVARRIEHITQEPAEKLAGMRNWEMRSALRLFGLRIAREHSYGTVESRPKRRRGWWGRLVHPDDLDGETETYWAGRPTLARWLRERDPELHSAACILSVTHSGHYIVVQGGDVADNHQGLVPVEDSKWRRARVRRLIVVTSRSD